MLSLTSVWQNANTRSQKHLPVNTILKKHEKEKKRAYTSRIMNVEHRTFSPLVFPSTGGKDLRLPCYTSILLRKWQIKQKKNMKKLKH